MARSIACASGVQRLVHDRYFAYDQIHGCDLTTGGAVRLDRVEEGAGGPNQSEGLTPASLIEVLDDGAPRVRRAGSGRHRS